MAIDTSLFPNKPFVKYVLQMFFKYKDDVFYFIFTIHLFLSALRYNSVLYLAIMLQLLLITLSLFFDLILGSHWALNTRTSLTSTLQLVISFYIMSLDLNLALFLS